MSSNLDENVSESKEPEQVESSEEEAQALTFTCPKCEKPQDYFILPSDSPRTPTVICPECRGQIGTTKIPKEFHRLEMKKTKKITSTETKTDSEGILPETSTTAETQSESESANLYDVIREPWQVLQDALKNAQLRPNAKEFLINKCKTRILQPHELAEKLQSFNKDVWTLQGIPTSEFIDDIVVDYDAGLKQEDAKAKEKGSRYVSGYADYTKRDLSSRYEGPPPRRYSESLSKLGSGGYSKFTPRYGETGQSLTIEDVDRMWAEKEREKEEREKWDKSLEVIKKIEDETDEKIDSAIEDVRQDMDEKHKEVLEAIKGDKGTEGKESVAELKALIEKQTVNFENKLDMQKKDQVLDELKKSQKELIDRIDDMVKNPSRPTSDKYNDDFYRFVADGMDKLAVVAGQKSVAKDVGLMLVALGDPKLREGLRKAMPQILASSSGGSLGSKAKEPPKDLKETEEAKMESSTLEELDPKYTE